VCIVGATLAAPARAMRLKQEMASAGPSRTENDAGTFAMTVMSWVKVYTVSDVASGSNSSNRWGASSGPRSPERKRSPIILHSSKRERRPAAGQLGVLSATDTAGGGDGPAIAGSNSALSWSTSSRPRLPDGRHSPAARFSFSHGGVRLGPNRRDMSSDLRVRAAGARTMGLDLLLGPGPLAAPCRGSAFLVIVSTGGSGIFDFEVRDSNDR
jgi:hypothetical protein